MENDREERIATREATATERKEERARIRARKKAQRIEISKVLAEAAKLRAKGKRPSRPV